MSTEGTIYLPETAKIIAENNNNNLADISNQAIMEVLFKFASGEDPLKDIAVDVSLDCQDSPNDQASPMLSPVTTHPINSSANQLNASNEDQSTQSKSLAYLLDSYSRVAVEERNHPKVCLQNNKISIY
jgi:ubiquitin conjugation factor E4 B